jgi:hypothetical protein
MDNLDRLLAQHFSHCIPVHNAAFRLQLDLWMRDNPLYCECKFHELPLWAQSEICQKAAVDLRGPTN